MLDEIERLAVEEHVLLLDAERVRIRLAEGVVEHAAAVDGALARDRRRIDLLHGSTRLRLDLDLPARVEQATDHEHRARRPDLGKDLAVRASDFLPVVRLRQVDPGPDDIREARAGFGERVADDLEAELCLLVGALGRLAFARDRCRAGDVNRPSGDDGAGVADDRLHR